MAVTKTAETQELGAIEERTSFFDSGNEIHTVTVRMGETTIDIKIHKRHNGELSNPEVTIHELKGKCKVFTTDVEKITKRTVNHTLDCGTKFKCVKLEVK